MRRFVEKGSRFSEDEIKAMGAEQFKIMRNVVAIHKKLQDAGQLEIFTTPFYHPILPLVHTRAPQFLIEREPRCPPLLAFPRTPMRRLRA